MLYLIVWLKTTRTRSCVQVAIEAPVPVILTRNKEPSWNMQELSSENKQKQERPETPSCNTDGQSTTRGL